jgi:predicted AAA+ superfamily ATPase
MKRKLYSHLLAWKDSKTRVPLIMRGARQVGKSYLLKEFGKNEFNRCHHFDFEKSGKALIPLFKEGLSPDVIIKNLSLFAGVQIDSERDLVIFDEIQNCPEALTSLKYFCEDMPGLFICAAGSLLGISLSSSSFPVGKVCYLDLYPMNFEEFLLNGGEDLLYETFCEALTDAGSSSLVHSKLWEKLKEFYVVGGMPGIVSQYFSYSGRQAEGMQQARHLQRELLRDYQNDFSKHSGKINALHISSVFENIPIQLASHMDGSVQRFRFKDVIPARQGHAALEGPIDWLLKAGLVYKVPVCQKAQLPLKAFTKTNIFKLFIFDIGILGCMLELDPKTLVLQEYGLMKGFFAENYVACELTASGERQLYSWSERNSEIEFIKDLEGQIVPIEVKSGIRTKAQSMRQYIAKYAPPLAVMISGNRLGLQNQKVLNYPLYYAGRLTESLRMIHAAAN